MGTGQNETAQGTAGFSPWFHLPIGFHFGVTLFLIHRHIPTCLIELRKTLAAMLCTAKPRMRSPCFFFPPVMFVAWSTSQPASEQTHKYICSCICIIYCIMYVCIYIYICICMYVTKPPLFCFVLQVMSVANSMRSLVWTLLLMLLMKYIIGAGA